MGEACSIILADVFVQFGRCDRASMFEVTDQPLANIENIHVTSC